MLMSYVTSSAKPSKNECQLSLNVHDSYHVTVKNATSNEAALLLKNFGNVLNWQVSARAFALYLHRFTMFVQATVSASIQC